MQVTCHHPLGRFPPFPVPKARRREENDKARPWRSRGRRWSDTKCGLLVFPLETWRLMVNQTLPSATKSTAGALLAARKRHVEDMDKTRTEVTVLLGAVDSMVGRFPYRISNQWAGTHFLILFRDKDTDVTWLYGPWKRNTSVGTSLSTQNLRPREPTYPSMSIRADCPFQNNLRTDVLQGILRRPLPLLPHRLIKRKVWSKPLVFIKAFPRSTLTIAGKIVRFNSHGREIAPGPFQPGSSTMSLSPAGYLLGDHFPAPNVQAWLFLVKRKGSLLIFVVQRPQIWTQSVASATSASEANWRKAPAIFVLEHDFLVRR